MGGFVSMPGQPNSGSYRLSGRPETLATPGPWSLVVGTGIWLAWHRNKAPKQFRSRAGLMWAREVDKGSRQTSIAILTIYGSYPWAVPFIRSTPNSDHTWAMVPSDRNRNLVGLASKRSPETISVPRHVCPKAGVR